ncbi:MAG: hypothetical protein E7621_01055 [Ruminococcaceae bacterium]|nr:hypothetical protein [Oscillospiraceae bacterium]
MNYAVGQLQIKKRSFPQWLSLGVFIMPFCLSFLMDILKLPSLTKYTIDLMWCLLLTFLFVSKKIRIKKNITPLVVLVVFWLLYVAFVYLFNYQSIFYFLWGIRNNLRFYIAFMAFASFLEEEDVDLAFNFLDLLFWINIPVSLYQFFVLGCQQDYLGGIFGIERGCNAYTSVFFALIITKSLLRYFEGQEKPGICLLKCGLSLILAAMAELKFYFVLFVIMVLISMIMTKFSWKKFVVLISFALLISFAGSILTFLFGSNEELTFQRIIELTTSENYATGEDLGRFTAIPTIAKSILTHWTDRMFGMGLGNCDTSAFAICNTPFFQKYEYLHYSWFSSAFLFLETGYLGLMLNLSFYFTAMFLSIRRLNKGNGNKLYCQIAIVFSVLCLILTFYNSALRKEVGYIAYFALSLPFICGSESQSEKSIGTHI